jgi:hypothetical protein
MRRRRPAPTASPDGGTYACRCHDREQANEHGHGQDRRPAEYNLARSEQDFEMTGGIGGHLLAWEDHTCHLCTSDVAGSCPNLGLSPVIGRS